MNFDYNVKRVSYGYSDQAMRSAVLTPIFGPTWKQKGVPVTMDKLRKLWYSRVHTLSKVGWPQLSGDDIKQKKQFMLNCPPFSVATTATGNNCNRILFCPFCWARRVVFKSYMQLLSCAYNPEDGSFILPPDVRAVEFRLRRAFKPLDRDARISALNVLATSTRDRQQREWESHYFGWADYGGFVMHSVWINGPRVFWSRSGVLLLTDEKIKSAANKKIEYPHSETPRIRMRLHSDLSRSSLASMVSRVCRFHPSMLKVDPVALMDVLSAFYGVHTFVKVKPSSYDRAFNDRESAYSSAPEFKRMLNSSSAIGYSAGDTLREAFERVPVGARERLIRDLMERIAIELPDDEREHFFGAFLNRNGVKD